MARLAGMAFRERRSGWNREAFTSESRSHILVWEKRRTQISGAETADRRQPAEPLADPPTAATTG